MPAYQDWVAATHLAGGSAVVWPFRTGIYAMFYGQPAGKFAPIPYTNAANSGGFDVTRPQQGTANNEWFYVLAPAAAIADAPHSMSTLQKIANAVFTAGDTAATAIGLPSLAGLESVVYGVAAIAGLLLAVEVLKLAKGFKEL